MEAGSTREHLVKRNPKFADAQVIAGVPRRGKDAGSCRPKIEAVESAERRMKAC